MNSLLCNTLSPIQPLGGRSLRQAELCLPSYLRSHFLIPLAPKLVRLRIRIRRWLHWNWAANLLEKHFNCWVWFYRTCLLVVGAVLLYLGWEDLRE